MAKRHKQKPRRKVRSKKLKTIEKIEKPKLTNSEVFAEAAHINKCCRLRQCEHADINAQDVGRIVEVVDKYGYGIEFTKPFKVSASKSEVQTNTIYGEAKHVEFI